MRGAGEPQTAVSSLPGGGFEYSTKEAETLRASGAAAAQLGGGEPGVGVGFCARFGGLWASDPGAECGGRVHTGVFGAGSGHQFCQPESDARAGANRGRTWTAVGDSLRQRAGADEPTLPGVVCGAADRVGAHSAGEADAERARRELSRTAAGGVFDGELVSESVRCAAKNRGEAEGVQRRKAAQQSGISDAEGVCYIAGAGLVRLRFAGSAVLSRKPGVGKCRMISCAKNGGRS